MKKILLSTDFGVGLLCMGCINHCTCVTTYNFASPGLSITNIDTTDVESREECSLMNMDTTYEMNSYDSLGHVNGTGYVYQQTICK